jgi:O-antigen/teichoic acid export membrane protein
MSQLKKNAFVSLSSLLFQSGYSAVLGLIANIILTIFGGVGLFGIYSLTQAALAIFNYFSDIGLAGALIQKKEVKLQDLRVVFTIQMTLVTILVFFGFIAGNQVVAFYRLDERVITLYHALLVGFFLSSLKTIPSVLLERSLQFQKIVRVTIIENTLFYAVVSCGILAGLDLYAFVIAVVARAFVGTSVMYHLSKWQVGLAYDRKIFTELLTFGLPYQSSTFLALFKDELIILFLGRVLGVDALGLVMWAKKWADAPIRIIMDNVSKVLFPLFSRVQDEKEKLRLVVEESLKFQTLVLAPLYVFAILLMPKLIYVVPRYAKWAPAVDLFQILAASAFLATFSTPFMNLFNSLKKTHIPLVFMAFWTLGTWLLVPYLTIHYGNYGFPITQIFLSSTCVLVIAIARRMVHFRLRQAVGASLWAALISGCIVLPFSFSTPDTLVSIVGISLFGGAVYCLAVVAVTNGKIMHDIRAHLPSRLRIAS